MTGRLKAGLWAQEGSIITLIVIRKKPLQALATFVRPKVAAGGHEWCQVAERSWFEFQWNETNQSERKYQRHLGICWSSLTYADLPSIALTAPIAKKHK